MYDEADLLMLSALQHFIFCPRQCALIHIEQVWGENRYTVEGRILHQRVHTEQTENRKSLRIEFGMRLRSLKLGLSGKADIVEIEYKDDKRKEIKCITPVEYKRGKPKKNNADTVQICAQAFCLEEMLCIPIQRGLIYYGKKRIRYEVLFTDELRQITMDTARNFHLLFDNKKTPPLDPVNTLLSFIYTIIMHDICSALEGCGLDPAVGYLHKDRPGRMGLALDMMEEFRSVIGDRLVLSLINRKQLQHNDFVKSVTGAFTLTDASRKTVLVSYQNRKKEEIYHPFIEEKIPIGLLFYVQAMLFARYIRGDIDAYPVFIWR